MDTDFTVIKGEGHALLGYKSAKNLGMLQINQVYQIKIYTEVISITGQTQKPLNKDIY